MKTYSLVMAFVMICCAALVHGDEPQNLPLDKLGKDYELIGKLHVPLGQIVKLEGVVVEGPFKGYEGGFNLRVQRIWHKAIQEDIQIVIKPFFYDWGAEVRVAERALPNIKIGETYEMEGYATGGYVGTPGEVFARGAVIIQTTEHYFLEKFIVTKAKKIERINFIPWDFKGEYALFQGKAVSQDGKAVMVGDQWSVVVLSDSVWPKHVEGKQIETWGIYNRQEMGRVFDLVDGQWRLINLEDQLGRAVELRGTARSRNDVWWFHYRGRDLYVQDMQNLPGWSNGNHWKPMVISGHLEKATLPRLDQISLKDDRDLKEHYIIRDASWKPLLNLLGPERPLPKQLKKRTGQ